MGKHKFVTVLGIVALTIAMVAVISFVFGYLFMLAWNFAVVPAISSARPITYMQAVVLMALISAFRSNSGVNKSCSTR